jgi:hypothetical protein
MVNVFRVQTTYRGMIDEVIGPRCGEASDFPRTV